MQTQARTRRMPQELCDIVISHLHDDVSSLKQCSSTCKAWELSSASFLFSRFSWPPCNTLWTQNEYAITCECPSHTASFTDFHDLILSSPRIRYAIRRLGLTGLRSSRDTRRIVAEPLPYILLYALPSLLPSMQALVVINLESGSGIMGPPPQIPSGRCHLKRLELGPSDWVTNHADILIILAAFSHIETVVLQGVTENTLIPTTPLASQIHRRFTKTAVDHLKALSPSWYLQGVTERLTEQLDCSALRQVTATAQLDANMWDILAAAPALEELTYMPHEIPQKLQNPFSLRILDLTCSFTVVPASQEPEFRSESFKWDDMMQHVSGLDAPNLHVLRLNVRLQTVGDWWRGSAPSQDVFAHALAQSLMSQDWSTLQDVMVRRRKLQKLKLLVFVVKDWASVPFMLSYLACCGKVMQEVAAQMLTQSIINILEVRAEYRTGSDIISYFP